MTTNPSTRRATVEGWLTHPAHSYTGRASEGHTSAVNVLRMVNSRHQHQAAEAVPFRANPEAKRSTGCGASSMCLGHPDCQDHHCEGHPDNTDQRDPKDSAFALRFWVSYGVFIAGCIGCAWWASL